MEPFLSTLPPYVHQYINKYPPTECFNVLKELICFAVLYANDRERINLLSLELLDKKADQVIVHRPYTSSTITLTSSTLSVPSVTSPDSTHQPVTPDYTTTHKQPGVTLSDTSHECKSILEEEQHASSHTTPILNDTDKRTATMPYTFPDWWAHPDTDGGQTSLRSTSPTPQRRTKTPERSMTQEMNITNWIPVDFNENDKPRTSRPSSVYNPAIPDLRSYLAPTPKKAQGPKEPVTRRTSVHSASVCESPISRSSLSRSSSTSTSYRPGQTATVRARAEQAKLRQQKVDEEKQKAQAKLTSRTSLRLKQSATSGIDWASIKQDRRKTLPTQSS